MSTKKHLQSQGKAIIAKVYHRMKYEAENGVENVSDARWRTSQAVGYSEHTVSNVLREERLAAAAGTSTDKAEPVFKSPSKRKRECPKSTLNDVNISVLRRTIMSFHVEFNETPTLNKLKQVLSEKIGFNGCIETFRTMLRQCGYEWATTSDNHKILVEKHDVQMARFNYLKLLKEYRDEGRYIVFTSKYVHTIHNTMNKCLKSEERVQKKSSKGMRVIVVHAGGSQGFVPSACFVFKATSASSDYHDNITFDKYKTWITQQLLPNIPEKAVIVMDNASYQPEKCPYPNSTKNEIQAWLTEKKISFQESMKKIELYDLVVKHKDKFKTFTIDELLKSKGFEVLHLPPYHPDLNPIENIWGIISHDVDKQNAGQDVTSVMDILKERIEAVDKKTWEDTCRHVNHIEKEYMKNLDMDFEFNIDAEPDPNDRSELLTMYDYFDE